MEDYSYLLREQEELIKNLYNKALEEQPTFSETIQKTIEEELIKMQEEAKKFYEESIKPLHEKAVEEISESEDDI